MRTGFAAAAAGLLAAAVLSACGGGGTAASTTSSAPSSSSTSAAAGSGSGAAAMTTVQVTARDFTFALAPNTFSAGTYTFALTNDGSTTHAMEIDGPGVEDQKAGPVPPGGTASLTVTLQRGTYTLYCPVDNHRAMGMQTTFTVG